VFPESAKKIRFATAVAFILFMIAVVIIIVISVIVYRLAVALALAKSSDDPDSSAVKNCKLLFAVYVGLMCQAGAIAAVTGAILNLIGISVLNIIYGKIAVILNDWENHQKQTDYDDALTFKFFIFTFVNSYTSIFYIAFFKVRLCVDVDMC
jgi:hypothetical protein